MHYFYVKTNKGAFKTNCDLRGHGERRGAMPLSVDVVPAEAIRYEVAVLPGGP